MGKYPGKKDFMGVPCVSVYDEKDWKNFSIKDAIRARKPRGLKKSKHRSSTPRKHRPSARIPKDLFPDDCESKKDHILANSKDFYGLDITDFRRRLAVMERLLGAAKTA